MQIYNPIGLENWVNAYKLSGEKATQALHQITTQDFNSYIDGSVIPAYILNPKGKSRIFILCLRHIFDGDWIILTDPQLEQTFPTIIKPYLGLYKLKCEPWFSQISLHLNSDHSDYAIAPGGPFVSLKDEEDKDESEDPLIKVIEILGQPLGVDLASRNDLIPLELPSHHSISSTKGCYPGQEIIARINLRAKGQMPNKIHLFKTDEKDIMANYALHLGNYWYHFYRHKTDEQIDHAGLKIY